MTENPHLPNLSSPKVGEVPQHDPESPQRDGKAYLELPISLCPGSLNYKKLEYNCLRQAFMRPRWEHLEDEFFECVHWPCILASGNLRTVQFWNVSQETLKPWPNSCLQNLFSLDGLAEVTTEFP